MGARGMTSESAVSQHTQYALSKLGGYAMRNNVGVAFDKTGRPIRYGLMNESRSVNSEYKSSDLIDCLPVLIKPHHVGRTFGLFVALETKHSDWTLRPGDDHARAQLRFINLIRKNGGMADFITDARQVEALHSVYA